MTKSEAKQIIDWTSILSNKQLEAAYYDAVDDTLGSEVQIMGEQGWDEIDIIERRKFEKWLREKADLLEKLCDEREIKLWEEYK